MFLETFIPYLAAAIPAFLLGLYIGRNSNTKVGTPSASRNSSSLPRCFYSVGSSCTAKSVQSCNRDFDSCEYRSSH